MGGSPFGSLLAALGVRGALGTFQQKQQQGIQNAFWSGLQQQAMWQQQNVPAPKLAAPVVEVVEIITNPSEYEVSQKNLLHPMPWMALHARTAETDSSGTKS